MKRPNFKIAMRGQFSATVMKADAGGNDIPGTARHYCVEPRAQNHLTDFGLNLIGTASASSADQAYEYLAVGDGSAPESNTDTQLAHEVAVTQQWAPNASGGNSQQEGWNYGISRDLDSPVKSYTIWIKKRFPVGTATGNLTEVGFKRGTGTPRNLVCRALFRDGGGNPITIPVQSDEILDVTYYLTVIIPHEDVTGTINIAGVPTGYVMRPCNAAQAHNPSTSAPAWPNYSLATLVQRGFKAGIEGGANTSSTMTALAANITTLAPYTGQSITSVSVPNPRSGVTVSYNPYVTDSFERSGYIEFPSGTANHAALNCLQISNQWGCWQILFDTPFTKTSNDRVRVPFVMSWGRG